MYSEGIFTSFYHNAPNQRVTSLKLKCMNSVFFSKCYKTNTNLLMALHFPFQSLLRKEIHLNSFGMNLVLNLMVTSLIISVLM
jgi:hypothetical protein